MCAASPYFQVFVLSFCLFGLPFLIGSALFVAGTRYVCFVLLLVHQLEERGQLLPANVNLVCLRSYENIPRGGDIGGTGSREVSCYGREVPFMLILLSQSASRGLLNYPIYFCRLKKH